MKKLFVIACAFAAVIGCQKAEMNQPGETDGVKVPVKVTADIAQTKTTMTNVDGVLKSEWKEGDELLVRLLFGVNIEQTVKYTVSKTNDVVEFVTDSEGFTIPSAAISNTQYRFVAEHPELGYSYSTNYANWREVVVPAVQEQTAPGDLDHIAKTTPLYALPVRPEDMSEVPLSLKFNMVHALSVLQLDLKGAEAGIKIVDINVEMLNDTGDGDVLVISDCQFDQQDGSMKSIKGSNLLKLKLTTPVELQTDSYSQFYMTISPGHEGKTFKVTATNEQGKVIEVGSMKVPLGNPIPRGAKAYKKFIVQQIDEDVDEDVDLDWDSAIDLSANGTANCYVVNKANQLYKFNATVKGNGAVPISLSETGIETKIAPKTALELWYAPLTESNVWEDKNPVILNSITLMDGYIYFMTPEDFVDGNVVIAAFAEEGLTYSNITADAATRELTNATVLWTWNLWCVENYAPENEVKIVGGYTIMNRNLGALINGHDIDVSVPGDCYRASYVVGNHYQMGRKDPMPSHYGYNSYLASYCQDWTPNFTPISALQQLGRVMYNEGTGFVNHFVNASMTTLYDALDCAVRLPYLFMSGSSSSPFTYSWYPNESGKYAKDLWGDSTKDAGDEVKTMFDPCPEGWMVWTSNAVDALWDACAQLTLEVRGNGIYVGDDMCFPFTSARIDNQGSGAMGNGYVTIYTSWGNTGAGNMSGDVLAGYLTSTNCVYSNTSPYIHDANICVKSVNKEDPTVTFNKYGYHNSKSLGHQRAARPVRCMKK